MTLNVRISETDELFGGRTNSLYCSECLPLNVVQMELAAPLLAAIKTSLQMSLVQPGQFFPDAFGYIRVPPALHLSNPFGMIYAFSTFCKQVLTDIWRSAPVTVGGPRKPVCKRWKQTSQCSQRHGNNRGQSTLDNRNAEDSN